MKPKFCIISTAFKCPRFQQHVWMSLNFHGLIHKYQPLIHTPPSRFINGKLFFMIRWKLVITLGRLFQAYATQQHFSFQRIWYMKI